MSALEIMIEMDRAHAEKCYSAEARDFYRLLEEMNSQKNDDD